MFVSRFVPKTISGTFSIAFFVSKLFLKKPENFQFPPIIFGRSYWDDHFNPARKIILKTDLLFFPGLLTVSLSCHLTVKACQIQSSVLIGCLFEWTRNIAHLVRCSAKLCSFFGFHRVRMLGNNTKCH